MSNKVNIVTFFNVPEDFEDLLTEFCEVNNLSILAHEQKPLSGTNEDMAEMLGLLAEDEDNETQP